MSGNGNKPKHGYVARVRDNTRRYIEELLQENVRLRGVIDTVGREQQVLRRQLDDLRIDLDRREQQHARLLALLGAAESAARGFEDRFAEVEQQNANLARLYAASYQLHATMHRSEVLQAIQEIVINLIGSEELAILAGGPTLTPLASMGVDEERLGALDTSAGALGRSLATRAPVLCDQDVAGIKASIPLVVGDRTLAVILIFGLLPQKPALDAFDRELLDLVATHAATALYCAELHEGKC
ncbi:MAG TPA: GAF domain-containing protein [Kofleriaceae bacterium]|nr:GAF domain-containing protein [Kofleriaceae bacterium]